MSEPSTTTIPSTRQPIKSALFGFLGAVVLQIFLAAAAHADDHEYRSVVVADPYLEMHTGPGRGYPIDHVVDRGETVKIIDGPFSEFVGDIQEVNEEKKKLKETISL